MQRKKKPLQKSSANINKKALPFPAGTVSKKPSADTRYLTRYAQMLFCRVSYLHSSAFLTYFFYITIIGKYTWFLQPLEKI
ncbi:MAG TPA: hypothetical protein DCZ76_05075 [Treponema sp.]|nr:hypothetical protein [Treponema sp.]